MHVEDVHASDFSATMFDCTLSVTTTIHLSEPKMEEHVTSKCKYTSNGIDGVVLQKI
jgi:hypothetical protein